MATISLLIERRGAGGFTLLELSIVLIVVSGLMSGALAAWTAQRQVAETRAAERMLDDAQEALFGFALQHGRLPCPAKAALPATDENAGMERCDGEEHGALPWRTLGLQELDPWGQRLGYFAQIEFTRPPAPGARAGFALDTVGKAVVRNASAGIKEADSLPAIFFSHGANRHGGYRSNGQRVPGGHPDELENMDGDNTFVAHLPTPDFDDHLRWIVPGILRSRLTSAGRLP